MNKNENAQSLNENKINAADDLQLKNQDDASALSETLPSPKKKSTAKTERKKRASANIPEETTSDTESVAAESASEAADAAISAVGEFIEEPDDQVLENQLTLPLFTISAQGFDSYEQNLENEEYENIKMEFDEDDDQEILPPDELFAYRLYKPQEPEKQSEFEEEEQIPDIPTQEDEEENVVGDGQYTMSDFELQADEYDKSYADEEIQKYDPKKPRRIDGRFDLVELFVFTLLAVMIITTFFFRHSVVEGSSMDNTLHSGEHVIISDLFYTPQRGDIIVCEDYTTKIPKPIVKRVIGVAGDEIVVTEKGEVILNGELLKEDYVYISAPYKQKRISITVPEGEIFVMGDHRDVSQDSRDIGTISVDSVLGKVILRFYPFNKFGTVN